MKTLSTARILLFDQDARLLLFKYRDPPKPVFWGTIGGRLEPGETLVEAARRELLEETGLTTELSEPAAWFLEHEMMRGGEPHLMKEWFFRAVTTTTALDDSRQTIEERQVIVGEKWWPVDEIETTDQIILPEELRTVIRAIAEGGLTT